MKILWGIFIAAILLELIILSSGFRVLIYEKRVRSGENYVLESGENIGKYSQDSLVCKFFNGRAIKVNVFWYSSNNFMGRDSCPFIYRPN